MSEPLFQRRHYVEIAAIIADIGDEDARRGVADLFAKKLAGTNVSFDSHRFFRAAIGQPTGKDKRKAQAAQLRSWGVRAQ